MRGISRQRTALMGFAALWVYYFHVVPVGALEGTAFEEVEWFLHRIGFCGVDMFFFLSAYGLYHGFRKRPVKSVSEYGKYLGRRLERIYPVIIPVAVVIALADNLPLRSLVPRLTFYDSFAINIYKFLWFVPCVLVLYLLAPLYDMLFERVRVKKETGASFSPLYLTVAGIVIAVVFGFLLRTTIRWDLYALVNRIPVFLLGFYFGYRDDSGKVSGKHSLWIALLVLTAGNVVSYLVNKGIWPELVPSMNALCNVLIAPPLILLLTALFGACERNPVSGILPRVFAFFGVVSLEFYAVQEWVWSKLEPLDINMTRRQVACFLICMVAAYGLHACATALLRGVKYERR